MRLVRRSLGFCVIASLASSGLLDAGDATFRPYVAHSVGSKAQAVAVGDLNGDGRDDVALVTSIASVPGDPDNDFRLHVFLQTPAGTLQRVARHFVGGRPTTVAVGDLNGDGLTDVAVGNGSLIGVFHQNASGSLDPMVTHPTARSLRIRIVDVNGDGRDDVVGATNELEDVDVLLQNGAGGLDPPITVAAPRSQDLTVADVTDDGRSDVILLAGAGVSVLRQRADGGLDPAAEVSVPGAQPRWALASGDLNADGRADLALSGGGNRPDSFVARLLQLPGGGFAPAESYASYDIPTALSIGDVDGDGRDDVAVVHTGWLATGIYLQEKDGNLHDEARSDVPLNQSFNPHGLASGDLNGDGTLDLAQADLFNGLVVLHQNTAAPPLVAITGPSTDPLFAGVPVDIEWTVTGPGVQRIDVFDSHDFAQDLFAPIAGCTALPATATRCTFTPPGPASQWARWRVQATDTAGNVGLAIKPYTIVEPAITLLEPTSAVNWGIGTARRIRWSGQLPPNATVDIELSRDGGSAWSPIVTAAPNVGTYDWRVTEPASATCRVRVSWTGFATVSDVSDADFAIAGPFVRVTAPNTDVQWLVGSGRSITWAHNLGRLEAVDIDVSRNGGESWSVVADGVANVLDALGAFTWTVTGPPTRRALVRIRWAAGAAVADVSDVTFHIGSIPPSLPAVRP